MAILNFHGKGAWSAVPAGSPASAGQLTGIIHRVVSASNIGMDDIKFKFRDIV